MTLVRPASAVAWDLRGAWSVGKRVALSLDERCSPRRVEGYVEHVAPTSAFVRVAGWHIPMDAILAVHNPSRVGDSTITDKGRWAGPPRRVVPQVEELEAA